MAKKLLPFLTGLFLFFGIVFAVNSSQAGDAEEILNLKNKIIQKQNKGTLGVQEFILCSKVLNYASFYPLAENTIKRGTKLLLYYEPLNWFTSIRDGRYEFYLTQDVILETAAGEVLFDRDSLLSMHYNTGKPILDIYMTNDFNLGNLPPGKYRYIIVLHDQISGQEYKKGIDFELVE